jgi:hypothetical protein
MSKRAPKIKNPPLTGEAAENAAEGVKARTRRTKAQIEATADEFEAAAQELSESANEAAEMQKAARVAAYSEHVATIVEASKVVDIVERAKVVADEVRWIDVKHIRQGDLFVRVAENTAENRYCALDILFEGAKDYPHFDDFRGTIVSHDGHVVNGEWDSRQYLTAFRTLGLRKLESEQVEKAVSKWALGRRQNDLVLRLAATIPAWDGVSRVESFIIKLFDTHDTPLNREFSRHFWMSFYGRMMMPGTDTGGLVPVLVGAPGCGKSHFGKRLAQIVSGNPEADSVQLNLDSVKDPTEFLRRITGYSTVASCGELSGLSRADNDAVKDFVARSTDKFRHLFKSAIDQQRQWCMLADANRIDGLLKDSSGNRRWYPIFCGQQPDEDGKPQWDSAYRSTIDMDSEEFESDVWQLLAEAKHHWNESGKDGYRALTKSVSKQVQEWSAERRNMGVGVVSDPVAARYLTNALASAKVIRQKERLADVTIDRKRVKVRLPECYVLYLSELSLSLADVAKRFRVNLERSDEFALTWAHSVGAIDARLNAGARAIVFGIGKKGLCDKFEYHALKDFTLDEDGKPRVIDSRSDGKEWMPSEVERRRLMIGLLGEEWEQRCVDRGLGF